MDIKYKEDIDIENHGLSSATDKGNLLSEIQNSNIDVKIKIEKDSEDLNKVDLLNEHDKIRIKEDPDSANNIKNEPVSNEVSAIYIKQEIEDEDSAKEKNSDPTDDKSGKEDDDGKAAKHKTRTEFQYRVTYTPRQRIELEKEFAMEKFVSLRRKSQLARDLDLSERQVKIWFQNRRSKERKHKKRVCKGEEQAKTGHISSIEPQVSLAKTQLDSIDRIKNNILLVQQLQQSVLSRLLAHNYRNEPEN